MAPASRANRLRSSAVTLSRTFTVSPSTTITSFSTQSTWSACGEGAGEAEQAVSYGRHTGSCGAAVAAVLQCAGTQAGVLRARGRPAGLRPAPHLALERVRGGGGDVERQADGNHAGLRVGLRHDLQGWVGRGGVGPG